MQTCKIKKHQRFLEKHMGAYRSCLSKNKMTIVFVIKWLFLTSEAFHAEKAHQIVREESNTIR